MSTLFYLSTGQIARIKPIFLCHTGCPELMTGVSSVGLSTSSRTACNGKMPHVSMGHTKLSTTVLSDGADWVFSTKFLRNLLSKMALQHD